MLGASTRLGYLGMARSIAHCRINVSFITAPTVQALNDRLCRLRIFVFERHQGLPVDSF